MPMRLGWEVVYLTKSREDIMTSAGYTHKTVTAKLENLVELPQHLVRGLERC